MPVRRLLLLLVCSTMPFVGGFVPSRAVAGEPPAAPAGFAWVAFDELGARFLVPDGWRASVGKGKLMGSLVLRERHRREGSPMRARLTVNVVSNLTKTNARLVSEQVARYASDLARSTTLELVSRAPLGHGERVGESLLLTGRTAEVPWTERRLYLADDRRDWLVVVSFLAATSDWETLRPLREPMLARFALD